MHPWVCQVWAFGSDTPMFISVGTVPGYSLKLGGCSPPVYGTVYYPYALLGAYSTCVMWTHMPLQLPPGAALSMRCRSRWEMDMVILNFSAGRCCNSVSFSETVPAWGRMLPSAHFSDAIAMVLLGNTFPSVRCLHQRISQQNTKCCCYLYYFELKRKHIILYLTKQNKLFHMKC